MPGYPASRTHATCHGHLTSVLYLCEPRRRHRAQPCQIHPQHLSWCTGPSLACKSTLGRSSWILLSHAFGHRPKHTAGSQAVAFTSPRSAHCPGGCLVALCTLVVPLSPRSLACLALSRVFAGTCLQGRAAAIHFRTAPVSITTGVRILYNLTLRGTPTGSFRRPAVDLDQRDVVTNASAEAASVLALNYNTPCNQLR